MICSFASYARYLNQFDPKNFLPEVPCFPSKPSLNGSAETWPSGRRRSPAKGVGEESSRGFESLRLRHLHLSKPKMGPYEALFSFGFKGV